MALGDEIAKTDDAGQAVCKLCNKHINCGSRGAVVLNDHVKSAKTYRTCETEAIQSQDKGCV